MDSGSVGSEYVVQQMQAHMQAQMQTQMEMHMDNMQNDYNKKLDFLSEQIAAVNQEKLDRSINRMDLEEDFIPEIPMDIIALVHEHYGSIADSYLNMISPLNPGIFEPSEQSVAVFEKNMQSIFGYLPKIFPTDREKITFLYFKSPKNYQKQIRELVKTPGPQRNFEKVFQQTFLNEKEKSWFHPIPKYLSKGARGELNVSEVQKWLDGLDRETIEKAMIFAFHSSYFRNELLKHNYEHGNFAAAVTTVNNLVRYNKSQKSEKGYRPNFRQTKPFLGKEGNNQDNPKTRMKPKSNE
ncbi:hypothetical protein SOMG_03540 [Schizosaccharomyces osmophilus]|uniref:Uncharacterized protein n=1 Tax=Schizosaccharomyces osmophilus TaxID=2545709 RepID=A0AAE9WBH0_9SCHI|nr:uncharacterized protein SOMG_03253 [Schizosaccharomyces osmophilus]XP_056037525.1 uncharacterized protein SOMG_03540 [Schizosaccharomyces osmophilus]UWL51798.1 Gag [Schizosaccharomyces osmophilus]WBW73100.1 hypothetical protein SOMG_03253 [Schizosaccharomyces osmophilus]WBW73282.1 hypothetical protein SOMG_03540 [Schizosaccharomyces osmophilus]